MASESDFGILNDRIRNAYKTFYFSLEGRPWRKVVGREEKEDSMYAYDKFFFLLISVLVVNQ